MKAVGITGGIGSGKTFVASLFHELGIPVYDADTAAKLLMNSDSKLKNGLQQLLGHSLYDADGNLNRKKMSELIFNDSTLRLKVNALVHPCVQLDFEKWITEQQAPFVLKESAILFEAGADKGLDTVICVTAPVDLRIKRTVERDKSDIAKVTAIMQAQMDDELRNKKCAFVILNDGKTALLPQVLAVYEKILNG
ncbi:MAG: dephospho-CoA kinase [Bacteroidetes bacterium]|nr:dephospho-CoA kinase [Bacteroidota bacterium]MCO5289041.1 dephospho-CoA kinase [Bacteroidota bacterium]MCW5930347.1 dephospho-CoA kinase [Bacteroidota bacterium]